MLVIFGTSVPEGFITVLITVGFEMVFELPQASPLMTMLFLHPTRLSTLRSAEQWSAEQWPASNSLGVREYRDMYGNRCGRLFANSGTLKISSNATVEDDGLPDHHDPFAVQHPVQDLPDEVLVYLLSSRYCEVDSELKDIAWSLFGSTIPGWQRVQAICDYVHQAIRFDYTRARATRTALDVFRERVGVCRDYTHLAITFCRNCNIPARYCTGYLGDIGVPLSDAPMDFSAWFEVFLNDRWYTFDARNNTPRIGRVLVARGRDAADVALTTIFGENRLTAFRVWTYEVESL